MSDNTEFLSTRQVAKLLHISVVTVRKNAGNGIIPAPIKLGKRKRLYRAEAIRRLLEDPTGSGHGAPGRAGT